MAASGLALPGKFARFQVDAVTVDGPFRWNIGFRRDRLDTTTFESTVGTSSATSSLNVGSDGVTGVLDTTFQVELYNSGLSAAALNIFFPDAQLACTLLFRKTVALGYTGIFADVLSFTPSTEVRGVSKGTVELQANGWVLKAA